MKTRRRRWGTPKNCESRTRHWMSLYPASAKLVRTTPKSRPLLLDKSPGTFSKRRVFALMCVAKESASKKSPVLAPASPALFPATLTSWHGNPPQTMSTFPMRFCSLAHSFAVTTSLCFGTSGQCFSKTARHFVSISTCPTQVCPPDSRPRSKPPTPANKDTNVPIEISLPASSGLSSRRTAAEKNY